MVGANLLDELVLRHGLRGVVDMEAVCAERVHGFLTDVFEEKKTKVLVVYGMKGLGLTDGKAD